MLTTTAISASQDKNGQRPTSNDSVKVVEKEKITKAKATTPVLTSRGSTVDVIKNDATSHSREDSLQIVAVKKAPVKKKGPQRDKTLNARDSMEIAEEVAEDS
jgi:hypothetical protein